MVETAEISAFVINFNGRRTVLKTIQSLLDSKGVRVSVEVLDDGSNDGSVELIRQQFPDLPLHVEPRNTGEVNRLRNKAVALAKTRLVLVSDNDLLYDALCLSYLYEVFSNDQDVATCIPRLMYWGDPDRVYTAGGRVHFIGATIAAHRGEVCTDHGEEPEFGVGGGNLLVDRRKFEKIGGFDEDYHLAWGDDGELYQRLLLAGYRCLYYPKAVALHEDKPFGPLRHYRAEGQVKNRWRFILTHYSAMTLLAISPALVIFELPVFLVFLKKRMPLLYLRAMYSVFVQLPETLRRRRSVQGLRRVSDKDVIFAGKLYVPSSVGSPSKLSLGLAHAMNACLTTYWSLVVRFL